MARRRNPAERFWPKVDRRGPDDCWPWTAAANGNGYGVFRLPGSDGFVLAHRFSMILDGRDPGPLNARHSCDNPSCVNPAHLEAGTVADNSADMVRRLRSTVGEMNPNAVLTEDDVRSVRLRYARGGVTVRALAAAYGVAASTMHGALRGDRWGHVDADAEAAA